MEVPTDFGIFRFTRFQSNPTGNGLLVDLLFVPDNNRVDAEKFGMVQMANSLLHGAPFMMGGDAVVRRHSIPAGPEAGAHIDKALPDDRNPLYALRSGPGSPNTLVGGVPNSDFGSLGKSYSPDGVPTQRPALLLDRPFVLEGDCEQRFETACIAIAGEQARTWYGSVVWGWKRVGGRIELQNPKPGSLRGTSAAFLQAVRIWNGSSTSTGAATIPLPLPEAD